MASHPLTRGICKLSAGQRFTAAGRDYRLGGKIGDGAVGLVRKAEDLESEKIVAVKFLAPDPNYIDPAAFDDVSQRFRREGIRGAELVHDNLIKVIAFEENGDGRAFQSGKIENPFIVMEYIRGVTLESLIRNLGGKEGSAFITPETLSIAARISEALEFLHKKRIVHRDVKPANVFLSTSKVGVSPSIVKLGDFGVTKWGDLLVANVSGTLTVTSQKGLGTLKYMSPEQALRPRDVTVRSDIFSFGITLFELFTGQILPNPHHVFEIERVRRSRASITGKLFELGLRCLPADEALFELILDTFLQAPEGRPTSAKLRGNLEFYLERLTESD